MSEHPRVEAFLRAFATESAHLPVARRRALRAEVAAHLHEVVPPDATDDEARLALLEFGTPQEVVAQEGVSAPVRGVSRWLFVAIAAVAVAAVAVVITVTRPSALSAGVPAPSTTVHDSVVSAHPHGAERETEGQAFHEYASEAGLLPELPPGAEWPVGVQAGLSEGLVADGSGVMEGGGGAWSARYTWLCAWEWEYLNATTVDDAERKTAAIEAFEFWIDSDFWSAVDPEGWWGESMMASLEEKRLRTFKTYFAQNCMQAGILGVQYSY
jgi:hypothetical protein